MWTILTMPQFCSSRRLVLTLERARPSCSQICSACEGFFREVEQGVDLGHGAIQAPAGAHFTPVEDEFAGNGRQGVHEGQADAGMTEALDGGRKADCRGRRISFRRPGRRCPAAR